VLINILSALCAPRQPQDARNEWGQERVRHQADPRSHDGSAV